MIIDGTNKSAGAAEKDPLLVGLGQRVKLLRARRGIPRRVLAEAADVSERHLANLESGIGNVSVLVLQQVAQALDCSPAELLGDETTNSPEWLMIRKLLHGRSQIGSADRASRARGYFPGQRPMPGSATSASPSSACAAPANPPSARWLRRG